MVLMIFVIMLLNLSTDELKPLKAQAAWMVLSVVFSLVGILAPLGLKVIPAGAWTPAQVDPSFGGMAGAADLLFTRYLFPFEVLSLVLLMAVVGALVMSKKRLCPQ